MQFLLQIFQYGNRTTIRLVIGFILLMLYNAFGAITLTLVIPFLELLFAQKGTQTPAVAWDWNNLSQLKEMLYYALSQAIITYGQTTVLTYFTIVLFASTVLKNIFRYLSSFVIVPLEHHIIQNLRNHIFNHLTRLSIGYFKGQSKGFLINIITNDVEVIQLAVVGNIMTIISNPITMVIYLLLMLTISWQLTLFTFIVLPLTGIALNFISKKLKRHANIGQLLLDRLTGVLDEFISGIRVVKSFLAEPYENNRYQSRNAEYTNRMIQFRLRSELASPVTEVISILVLIIVILFGGKMILAKESPLKPSEFIGFIALFSQFIAPIKTLANAIARFQKAIVSYARIQELLNEPIPFTERPTIGVPLQFEREIRLNNVSFKYEDQFVLQDISLVIPKGKTVAFVGHSGSGKSTVVDLICHFYPATAGQITIDGVDINTINTNELRAILGIVSQDNMLFYGTVSQNIAYAQDSIDQEQVIVAATRANAHPFISQMDNGYESIINEKGANLSGGQKQRIAIARALYRNPKLLIFDEATSALDAESEKFVQESIQLLSKDRTCILIAHRLSTIVEADIIYVLKAGQLVGAGSHAELMNNNPIYQSLYHTQFNI
jgi:ATP-binding cassette, subfamily B, bacterial MsbA